MNQFLCTFTSKVFPYVPDTIQIKEFTATKPEIRPNFSGSHTFSLTATAKIGPDTNSVTFVLVTARFWP